MDLRIFGWVLLIKILWRALFGNGIWQDIVKDKYLKQKSIVEWFRQGNIGEKKGS